MVWLIGCKGMLGTALGRQLTQAGIKWVGSDLDVDITDPIALENFADSHDSAAGRTGNTAANKTVPGKITWVINCAAYTAVDKAESNEELAKKHGMRFADATTGIEVSEDCEHLTEEGHRQMAKLLYDAILARP